MTKLNQIIAVEKGVKSKAVRDLTNAHQKVQKQALLNGLARNYQPRDDQGETLPPEQTLVQVKAEDALQDAAQALTRLLDVTATKDYGNTSAVADVVVDGRALVTGAPVTYLLFLEKQLIDVHTFVSKLPTLDPSESWERDESTDSWRTPVIKTTRTKKVLRNHVKAEATEKHPAQVDVYTEDTIVGDWSLVKFSGALPAARVNELKQRVEKLQDAVKFAREEANSTEVANQRVGESVFGYLFA